MMLSLFLWGVTFSCLCSALGASGKRVPDGSRASGVISSQVYEFRGDTRTAFSELERAGDVDYPCSVPNLGSTAAGYGDPRTPISAEDCAEICSFSDSCSHYTYKESTRTCELKSGKPLFHVSAGDVISSKSCDQRCFVPGVSYRSAVDSTPPVHVELPTYCQANCAADPNCVAFTWRRSDKLCYLKGIGFSGHKQAAENEVSGPRGMCDNGGDLEELEEIDKEFTCVHMDNRGSKAETIGSAMALSLEQCARKCQEEDTCTHYTQNASSGMCYLKKGKPVLYTFSGDRTGARSCDSSCFEEGVTYQGGEDSQEPQIFLYPIDCQAACAGDPVCKAWYWLEKTKTCYLKKRGFAAYRKGEVSGAVAGPRTVCDEGGDLSRVEKNDLDFGCVHRNGVGSRSPSRKSFPMPTLGGCRKECQADPMCTHFTYNRSEEVCSLKAGVPQYFNSANETAGPRTCDPTCFQHGVMFLGGDEVMPQMQATLPNDCQAACAGESRCKVFTWRESEKKCYFRGNGFSMSKIDDVRGVISGPRQFCDEGGDLRQLAEEDQTKGCVHAVNQDSKAETIGDPKTVDDMASCMRHCQGQKDCTHFVYSGTSKLCTLKKGRMELEEREDAVTGPRSCDASCFASGVEYGEGGLLDVSTMSTTVPADCQALCAAEPRCRAFTWKTQTKSCEFYGQGFSKNKKVGVAGAVSGPQEFCDKGGDLYRTEEQDAAGLLEDAVVDELPNATYPSSVHACIHPGIGSAAPDIAEPRKVEDFDSCAKSCRDTQGCVHYTFNEETFLCALKSGRPVFTTSSREQTGSRSCDTSCFVLQVDYWGAPDVLPSLKTTAATDCQAACAADAACKAFVWREGPSECFFKGSGFSQHKSIGAKGTVAGPAVFCDLGGNLREAEDADGHARGDSHESEGETN